VVIVWDGMRPDFVTEKYAPVLFQLARDGVTFRNHHPVYLSSTEVNGTAIATGVYPARSGIIANWEYRPEVNLLKALGTESFEAVYATGKRYLGVKTVAEILHDAGYRTAVAGTKQVALLQDYLQSRESEAAKHSAVCYVGKSLPAAAMDAIVANQGPYPVEVTFPNDKEDEWTAKALTENLWKEGLPAYSLLWLSEPDFSQHQTAPGSEMALNAIKSSDDRLATVLSAIDAKGARKETDVFIVSDHGFSTNERSIDLAALLTSAGFTVGDNQFKEPPKAGDIMIVGLGGSALFYVINHDETVVKRLVEFLQQSDFAGVIFSRTPQEGTFTLEQGRINSGAAPDVVLAFQWNDKKNKYGAPGMVEADAGRKVGRGTHGSLSRFEMHNTLIAAGPDFLHGKTDDLPTGNTDLAPTILRILGVARPSPMDGRVLSEALVDGGEMLQVKNFKLEATRDFEKAGWRQYLDVSQVGTTVYFNEGNGGAVSK